MIVGESVKNNRTLPSERKYGSDEFSYCDIFQTDFSFSKFSRTLCVLESFIIVVWGIKNIKYQNVAILKKIKNCILNCILKLKLKGDYFQIGTLWELRWTLTIHILNQSTYCAAPDVETEGLLQQDLCSKCVWNHGLISQVENFSCFLSARRPKIITKMNNMTLSPIKWPVTTKISILIVFSFKLRTFRMIPVCYAFKMQHFI